MIPPPYILNNPIDLKREVIIQSRGSDPLIIKPGQGGLDLWFFAMQGILKLF
jgi:hypothetical protein